MNTLFAPNSIYLRNEVVSLLENIDVSFLNSLKSQNNLDDFLSQCIVYFQFEYQEQLNTFTVDYVLSDEAQMSYFEDLKHQIISNYVLKNKQLFN